MSAKWRLSGKLLTFLLILSLRAGTSLRADEPTARGLELEDESPAPPAGAKPVEVQIAVRIIDIARINVREEFYEVHAYIEERWVDDRAKLPARSLAEKEVANHWRRISPAARLWIAKLSFSNAVEDVKILNQHLFADDDGNMLRSLELNGKFSKPFQFRNFPFDSQDLHIYIQADPMDRDTFRLTTNDSESLVQDGAFVPDWEIGETATWINKDVDRIDHSTVETFIMEIKVHRRSTFYIYRVLLPLTLLVIGSWSVFWFDVSQLQPQISTSLSIMLSNVMFSFGIDFGLPRLPYLTMVDRHALLSFLFAFVAILSVTYLHVTFRLKGVDVAHDRQRRVRTLFPISYLGSLLVMHAGG